MKGYTRKNFKLSFNKDKTTFLIDENKKTVDCRMECFIKCPHSEYGSVNLYYKPFVVISVAKCSGNDKFDIERGKRVALAKAENIACKRAIKLLNEDYKHLVFITDAMRNFSEKAVAQIEHNEDYIDSVTNTQHPNYKSEISPVKSGKLIMLENNN